MAVQSSWEEMEGWDLSETVGVCSRLSQCRSYIWYAAARGEKVVVVVVKYELASFIRFITSLSYCCHWPSPGPASLPKPRSHLSSSHNFIKLCSTNAIKRPQLRVSRWKVWHFTLTDDEFGLTGQTGAFRQGYGFIFVRYAPLQPLHQAPLLSSLLVSFYPFLDDGPYGLRVVRPNNPIPPPP